MTPRTIEKIILKDGWYFERQVGSHRHYRHRVKRGKVTIPFHHKPKDLPKKVLASIFRQAQLDLNEYLHGT